jgi:hypothetical protein
MNPNHVIADLKKLHRASHPERDDAACESLPGRDGIIESSGVNAFRRLEHSRVKNEPWAGHHA